MAIRDEVVDGLATVVAQLPGGGEVRDGQRDMAVAVADAIDGDRHLVVQAGTGTGKTLAYLIPAVVSGRRTIVATATKALQDQLVGKDLPFLATHLDTPFTFAMLKGRSNYLCLQRAREVLASQRSNDDGTQLDLGVDPLADRAPREELVRLIEWATTTATGDRADLTFEPSPQSWAALSVSARECPGRTRCPSGDACFADRARDAAQDADIVVVNTHLYGLDIATGGVVLPEHDVVVFDEVHQLEEVISSTAGIELSGGAFTALSRTVKSVVADDRLIDDLAATAGQLNDALAPHRDRRVRSLDDALTAIVTIGRSRTERALAALRKIETKDEDASARKTRAVRAATSMIEELDAVMQIPDSDVAWVEGAPHALRLKVAPVDVAPALGTRWPSVTAVMTSATVPSNLGVRVGLPVDGYDTVDVGSPFDYANHALLYCAAHLPDPRNDAYEAAMHDELEALIVAAGGRTLALFTSWRAMHAAVEAIDARVPFPILDQTSLPKPALVAAFAEEDKACLFATMGFWQGVDVPGPTLSLVTIDRIPFPRPDEPLYQAKRERARQFAFAQVDLPRAATLLAQGTGRLIRTANDKGVVAVLDPRLATARYRWDIVNALPPMKRTKDRAEVEQFLSSL